MKFRDLRADEVDCRIGTISEKGLTLLLFKDARVDMAILDETVGAENWQRKHYEVKGNMFCSVGICCGAIENPQWIWKDDCGTESNTEKEKGEASDSFKRACFNWGIGRELYTSPFIWINATDFAMTKNASGKCATYDKFVVKEIQIVDKVITKLTIVNSKTSKVVYKFGTEVQKKDNKEALAQFQSEIKRTGKSADYFLKQAQSDNWETVTIPQIEHFIGILNKLPDKAKE